MQSGFIFALVNQDKEELERASSFEEAVTKGGRYQASHKDVYIVPLDAKGNVTPFTPL